MKFKVQQVYLFISLIVLSLSGCISITDSQGRLKQNKSTINHLVVNESNDIKADS